MRVLALDTTTRAGSVALVSDHGGDRILEERAGDATRTHAQRLPSEIAALLASHELRLSDIDLFAVASGPGSFTGLRVGIATMQGFALVGRRPMVGISALAALAHAGSRDLLPNQRVGAWMDAHRRDVFAALFVVTGERIFRAGRLTEVDSATVGDPLSTFERWRQMGPTPAILIGDGAQLYADLIARVTSGGAPPPRPPDPPAPATRVEPAPALAGVIGLLALDRARRGETVTPAGIQPLYVRRPDAELAREHALADRRPHVSRAD